MKKQKRRLKKKGLKGEYMTREELQELKKEYWKLEKKWRSRKATKEEKNNIRAKQREIIERIGKYGK